MIEKRKIVIAWYRPSQWDRLLEISLDADELEKTYQEWITQAEEKIDKMKKIGLNPVKIDVDVEKLKKWCEKVNQPIDGSARVEYAIYAAQDEENVLE